MHIPLDRPSVGSGSFATVHDPGDRTARTLFRATVVDVVQWCHSYLISADNQANMLALAGGTASTSPMGFREHFAYLVGTTVLCARLSSKMAIILCSVPPIVDSELTSISDSLLLGAAVGVKDDQVHRYITTLRNAGGIRNFNNGRPTDVMPGEHGWSNNLGLGIFLGQTVAAIRASDTTGAWFFYERNLARIMGYNLEIQTAAREESSGDDQGECNEIVRLSPYPWEMRGAAKLTDPALQATDGSWKAGNEKMAYEPVADDQTGIFRLLEFRGYLGDLKRTIVACPSSALSTPEKLSGTSKYVGLSETVHHPNGALAFRSAKGIHFEKTLLIPVPRQQAEADDPAGDTPDNYRFSGVSGSGPEHDKVDYPWPSDQPPPARSARLRDFHAYLHNNYGQVAFDRHAKDWVSWQESGPPEDIGEASIDKAILAPTGKQFLSPLPQSLSLKVDHRPGHSHKYYKSRASFDILDDGSVVLQDAWGSSITLSGGNIYLNCPGDLIAQPGRSAITMAPRDIVQRAGRSVDITAAQEDIRLKAEKNLHALAGNSGVGGLLLESRAIGDVHNFNSTGSDVVSSGIALISKQSPVRIYGDDVYVRSLSGSAITLDADRGNGSMYLFASSRLETVAGSITTAFGTTADRPQAAQAVEKHDSGNVSFGQSGRFLVGGSTLHAPNATAYVGKSLFAFSLTQNTGTDRVGKSWDSATSAAVSGAGVVMKQLVPDAGSGPLAGEYLKFFSDPTKCGSDTYIQTTGFTLRTDAQYAITNLAIFETAWQANYRQGGFDTVWNEPVVNSPTNTVETMPWPGKRAWSDDEVFFTGDSTYWDDSSGCAADRGQVRTPPKLIPGTMKQLYLVNLQ
jgi:hypothetical protein